MLKDAFLTNGLTARPWVGKTPPRRILFIRLQAMGDMVITLPYIQQLQKILPENTLLDLLTREEVAGIAQNIVLFNKVFCIKGGRNFKKQLFYTCTLLPALLLRRYDVVIDLQNNQPSRMVARVLMPKAWSVFNRFAPLPAGERTRLAIEAAGLGPITPNHLFTLKTTGGIDDILREHGWNGRSSLVILNPAGAFSSRHWPLDNYITFANLWLASYPNTQFVVTGIDTISQSATYFKQALGSSLVNIVNQTTPVQAFALVQKAAFVLSEDSGLMHMAWVQGRPTLALFGSTRSDWARPLGSHSAFLDSSDLACGNCMQPNCMYGDTRCLTRYTPQAVFAKAQKLLASLSQAK